MRHRTDETHELIRDTLRKMGRVVLDCSQTELGFDLLVADSERRGLVPCEVKTPGRLGLTPHESRVHAALKACGIHVPILTSLEDVEQLGRVLVERREYR